MMKKLYLVSLGCARNLIDSEVMLGRLKNAGWRIEEEPDEAEIIIVNTCSFIESAVNESIDTILELAAYKNRGACRNLIVTGCLPERFRENIVQALPEVDLFLGTGALGEIVDFVNKSTDDSKCYLPDPSLSLFKSDQTRLLSSPYMAYLKVAEGCDKYCTYCIIPKLRGRLRSRTLKDIVEEAKFLIDRGTKELVLVAQDTTAYGNDLSSGENAGKLLDSIAGLSDDIWIRALYGHPESVDEYFIHAIGSHKNICSYFDIPVQHVSPSVLKTMGRMYRKDDLYNLFERIKSSVPDASLRTTLITGFPGETEKDFYELMLFIEDIQFDHLGVFMYSDSEDLPSHRLPGHIPKKTAQLRYNMLMSRQKEIARKNNKKWIGKTIDTIVETKIERDVFMGRNMYQAPDVDGITYIHGQGLKEGLFVRALVTDTLEYDLVGEAICGR